MGDNGHGSSTIVPMSPTLASSDPKSVAALYKSGRGGDSRLASAGMSVRCFINGPGDKITGSDSLLSTVGVSSDLLTVSCLEICGGAPRGALSTGKEKLMSTRDWK